MQSNWIAVIAAVGTGAFVAWAAGPTALQVKFKLPPQTNTVKPIAVVDGDGNLLFTATTAGKVEVTNLPAQSPQLAPARPSDVRTVRSTGACPGAIAGVQAFDTVLNPDGTTGACSIPAGKVFVVTSLGVVGGTGAFPATPDEAVQVHLVIGNGSSIGSVAVKNTNAGSPGSLGPGGSVGLHVTFPTGIVAKSGSNVCIYAVDPSDNHQIGVGGTINGYLADDV